METSFFTGMGHMCRFICIAIFAVISINASLNETPMTIKKGTLPEGKVASFRAESAANSKIMLKWKPSLQSEFSYAIEKSRDGEKFIPAEGKMLSSDGEFTWIDGSPRTINCYRIKMTDKTGQHFYSKVLVLQYYKTGQVGLVTATPDHFLNNINVDLNLKEDAFVTMNIIDKDNQIILQRKENAKEGLNQFTLNGSNKITPGDYYLNVVVNGADKLMVHLEKSN